MKKEFNADVTIIGGGIIGLSSAYYLQKAGLSVAVVEQNTIGSGASFGNAGYFCPSHFIPLAAPGMIKKGLKWMFNPESPFYIKPRLNADLIKWLWLFNRYCTDAHIEGSKGHFYDFLIKSLDMTEALVRDEKFDCNFERRGLYMLYKDKSGLAGEAKTIAMANELGYAAKMMTADEIAEKESGVRFSIAGGSYYEGDAHADPYKFIQQMKARLEAAGVTFIENEAIDRVEKKGNRVYAIESENCRFTSKKYVLASGAWSPILAKEFGLSLPVQAGKGYSFTFENSNLKPSTPYILNEAKAALTPIGNKLRFAGTMELTGINTKINSRRLNGLVKSIPKFLPDFKADLQGVEPWAGLRPVSPDGLPIISRAKQENLVLATGHAMLGVSLALITGKLVEELSLGNHTSVDPTPYRFDRF
jgi:D-amino-acid dehydrogenase